MSGSGEPAGVGVHESVGMGASEFIGVGLELAEVEVGEPGRA